MADDPPPAHEILIAISALQHHLYCPRQCALIHVDGLWAENRLTVEGALLHRRVDRPGHRTRRQKSEIASDRSIERSLPLHSDRLGLTGKADTVEFPTGPDGRQTGPPRPVEYKRGRPKHHDADRVQLCAQALCLEEMLACE
ncbi:MAG: CRISPR-associated protein Cas4, partial [Phycisphaerales bacterium]|nr:CRISPR-associated protein Cas4 [Phycisphaerales bacterium]